MDISVVVTCYNEEKNIQDCLDSLMRQNYSSGKYEIIISDGNSSDSTQAIAGEYARRFAQVRLVTELKRGTAAGRNTGVKIAKYDYVAFIDADCEAPFNWLSLLGNAYQSIKLKYNDVIAVGGRNIPPAEAGKFLQALEIVLDSYPGSFHSVQGRQYETPVFVPSVSTVNALYEKRGMIAVGCFDETLGSEAEDADINHRLWSAGYKFFYISDSFVWHKMRLTPRLWIKNMFRYGKGRARLLKRYPDMWRLSFLLPICFVVAMVLVPLGIFSKMFYLPLLYFPFMILFSGYQCIRRKAFKLIFQVSATYIMQHFAYAGGEIYGLVNLRVK